MSTGKSNGQLIENLISEKNLPSDPFSIFVLAIRSLQDYLKATSFLNIDDRYVLQKQVDNMKDSRQQQKDSEILEWKKKYLKDVKDLMQALLQKISKEIVAIQSTFRAQIATKNISQPPDSRAHKSHRSQSIAAEIEEPTLYSCYHKGCITIQMMFKSMRDMAHKNI